MDPQGDGTVNEGSFMCKRVGYRINGGSYIGLLFNLIPSDIALTRKIHLKCSIRDGMRMARRHAHNVPLTIKQMGGCRPTRLRKLCTAAYQTHPPSLILHFYEGTDITGENVQDSPKDSHKY